MKLDPKSKSKHAADYGVDEKERTNVPTTTRKAVVKRATQKATRAAPVPSRRHLEHKPTTDTVELESDTELLIPKPWFFDDYVNRTLPSGKLDVEVVHYARLTHENILFMGPTGGGKTSCVYAYAAERQIKVVNIACNGGVDPNTLLGRWQIVDGDTIFVPSNVTLAMQGKLGPVIVLLDEFNMMPPRISPIFHGALDKRRIGTLAEMGNLTFDISEDCQFIASINVGYEGSRPLSYAMVNRFSWQLEFDYEPTIESKLVSCPTILKLADDLRAAHKAGEYTTPCSTNMLMELEVHALDMGFELAVMAFVNHFHTHERPSVHEMIVNYSYEIEQEITDLRTQEDGAK